MRRLAVLLLLFVSLANAQTGSRTGVLGRWQTPAGDVIEVLPCAPNVCARIVAIRHDAPSHVDGNNPDAAQRNRSLCGLRIGSNFHMEDPTHAEGGQLYDPKSGKTYRGSMTSEGDRLKLRGYVGIKLFGRSETWTRLAANAQASTCK